MTMNWWGKLIGGAFGYMIGGPLGALFGAAIGHNFDHGIRTGRRVRDTGWRRQEQVQTAFFTATFAVMGRLCKLDGRVSESEIAIARRIMAQMNLTHDQQRVAMALFNQGKRADFPIDEVLQQARREFGYQPNLIRMFIEIQLYAAYADGELHAEERRLLEKICGIFGLSGADLDQLAATILGGVHQGQQHAPDRSSELRNAYAVLGVQSGASDAEVKKAYRRLMSRHHPDKLVSQGLPEEMMQVATRRTHEIRQAYEQVKQARGF